MIPVVAFLAFDMFGLQIARISDVTKDGVDEIVVTDPVGDREKPRDGRVLIVDPTTWSIVREWQGEPGETWFGSQCCASLEDRPAWIAVTANAADLRLARRNGVLVRRARAFQKQPALSL